MKPLLLCILDGVGLRNSTYGNAVAQANMPNFNRLLAEYPNAKLEASGKAVGLPEGQMGNSEVGHLNIGAGRVVYQPIELINRAIESGEIRNNQNLLSVIDHVKINNSKLHILGLVSDGGVHSHINHLLKIIDICKENNVSKLYIHAYLDGRDTLPNVAEKYLDILQAKLDETNIGVIATISGRYYAMDRDNRWERVAKAYKAIALCEGPMYENYHEAIKVNYQDKIYDEFIVPCILDKEGNIEDNDGAIVFNFRPDRLRELNMALTNPNFNEFERPYINNLKLVTMMPVSQDVICKNLFHELKLKNTLGEYLSECHFKQLRIAETEKYAHVTYFFDGGLELKLNDYQKILIPSPKVATYDLKPEMSAYAVTDTLLKELDKDYDFIVLNFANGDMVGHTGNLSATIKAMETIDKCLEKIFNKVKEKNGVLLITADHGNSEEMLDEQGRILTAHSLSKVPFIITNKNIKLKDGKLANIAPTILELLNLPKPKEMTEESLIER